MNTLEIAEDILTQTSSELKKATAEKPSVAIVILNWNGKRFLEKFLPSVVRSTYANSRIIVADNASSDASIEFLRNSYPNIEIIINSGNLGFAKGYNEALKQVRSDYYVLLNSDVEVTTDWIEPIIDLMASDDSIAACQPKILRYANKDQFEYAGAGGGWLDKFGYPFARGRVFDVCEDDKGQYDNVQSCFWASGAAMFIRSDVFHEMKGFDEFFFAHQEEIDLCWRLQLAGYKVYVQPASIVYHIGGGTLPKGNNRKVFLNFRNNLIMLAKNLPVGAALWKLPFRMTLDAVSAWENLIKGNGGYFIAVLKAHFHFVGWLFFKKSRSVFPNKKNNKLSGYYNGSVVWDHFVKKKKRFSEIVGNK